MEITINVPKNTYAVPTEIRQEVVQTICDAFLYGSVFHPRCHGGCPNDRYVERKPYGAIVFSHAEDKYYPSPISYRVRGCEMDAAVRILVKAGYHIFRKSNGGYELSRKPVLEFGNGREEEVTSFVDFID